MVSTQVSKSALKRSLNTQKRYAHIRQMFDSLYSKERKRIDDVEREVMDHFCISERTLERALKSA